MSKLGAWIGANTGMAAGAAVVVVAAVGMAAYFAVPSDVQGTSTAPDTPSVTQAAQLPDATSDADSKPQTVPQTAPPTATVAATPEPIADQTAPTIDEVRLEADGLTIIAGRAAPGSEVSVLLDGQANTTVTADDTGSFAAITILPDSAKARVLSVTQRVGMDERASVDEVILAPRAAPAPVAVADDPGAPPVPANTAPITAGATGTDAPAPAPPVPSAAEQITPGQIAAATPPAPPAQPRDVDASSPGQAPEQTTAQTTEPAPAAPAPAAPAPAAPTPATQGVTVLRSTAAGVEVLSDQRPEALDTIALDTISYTDAGDVQLAGRAQADAEVVRVYVDNRPVADLSVDAQGDWRGDLPDIDTGVYTLRVDELDAGGQVTSRIETPFRREDPDVLADMDDATSPATQITVQAGASLWAIARDRYGEGRLYVRVFEANRARIRDADMIFPGQVFALPE